MPPARPDPGDVGDGRVEVEAVDIDEVAEVEAVVEDEIEVAVGEGDVGGVEGVGEPAKKPSLGQRSEELAAMAGTMPMTCSTAERWSPVTLVGEFMDWRSFRRMPWVRVAIVVVMRERERVRACD